MKAPHANEARNEPEGHRSAAWPKAAVCPESGRRYKKPTSHTSCLDSDRVMDRETVKVAENEIQVEAEPLAFLPTSTDAAVSGFSTNGESDVEALLARLRAL